MEWLWIILFIAVAIIFIEKIFGISEKIRQKLKPPPEYPYFQKALLTEHETEFYHKLKPLTDAYGLCIIAKTRLADLIDVKPSSDKAQWKANFAKVQSKHIDFVIVEPECMTAECLIELDDSSHDAPERQERDEFLNTICRKTGWRLIRTYGDTDEIEEYLDENWVKI